MPTATSVEIEPSKASFVRFRTSVYESELERLGSSGEDGSGSDGQILPIVIVKLLDSARASLAHDGAQADRFIARAATLLRTEVEREGARRSAILSPPDRRTHLAPWQARRAVDFIERNLAEPIRIRDIAAVVRLGPGHFSRAFRADFGESPYAYVIRRRIDQAREMMLLTDKSLAAIAVGCGLADQPHLTRLFRRIVGMSPASWRRLRLSVR
jgi:AraC family transcriptional regulator